MPALLQLVRRGEQHVAPRERHRPRAAGDGQRLQKAAAADDAVAGDVERSECAEHFAILSPGGAAWNSPDREVGANRPNQCYKARRADTRLFDVHRLSRVGPTDLIQPTPSGFSVSGDSGQSWGHQTEVSDVLSIMKTQYGYQPGNLNQVVKATDNDKFFIHWM